MKNIYRICILIAVFALTACFSDWAGDTGRFSISIGGSGSGRTALPWNDDIQIEALEHDITLEGLGPKQSKKVTGVQTVQFSVVPGVWNISIEAKYENELIAVGSRTVDIKPGPNGTITISMSKPALMEMVWVQGGTFQLGKDLGTAATGDVTPLSNVTVNGFYIGKYQVTQAQWQAVMGTTIQQLQTAAGFGSTNYGRGDAYPVYCVSWYDALVFCNKLSVTEGLTPAYRIANSTNPDDWGTVPTNSDATWNAVEVVRGSTGYRLPTEAQWEYAAKGGNPLAAGWVGYTYAGSDTVGDVAWYEGNNGSSGTPTYGTKAVGTKAPNGLGIYDMSGNVWEWCWDWYGDYTSADKTDPTGASSGSSRVGRGGGYRFSVAEWNVEVRSVYRHNYIGPSYRYDDLGFRLVRPVN